MWEEHAITCGNICVVTFQKALCDGAVFLSSTLPLRSIHLLVCLTIFIAFTNYGQNPSKTFNVKVKTGFQKIVMVNKNIEYKIVIAQLLFKVTDLIQQT